MSVRPRIPIALCLALALLASGCGGKPRAGQEYVVQGVGMYAYTDKAEMDALAERVRKLAPKEGS
jgi:hypothetical protein